MEFQNPSIYKLKKDLNLFKNEVSKLTIQESTILNKQINSIEDDIKKYKRLVDKNYRKNRNLEYWKFKINEINNKPDFVVKETVDNMIDFIINESNIQKKYT